MSMNNGQTLQVQSNMALISNGCQLVLLVAVGFCLFRAVFEVSYSVPVLSAESADCVCTLLENHNTVQDKIAVMSQFPTKYQPQSTQSMAVLSSTYFADRGTTFLIAAQRACRFAWRFASSFSSGVISRPMPVTVSDMRCLCHDSSCIPSSSVCSGSGLGAAGTDAEAASASSLAFRSASALRSASAARSSRISYVSRNFCSLSL